MPPFDPSRNKAQAAARDFAAARAYHEGGDLARADALYQKVLRAFPAHADSLNLAGLIALDRGRPERAVQLIRKATEAAPLFPDAHLNLGNALLAAGRTDAATAAYGRALALNPRFAAAHSNLARAYTLAGANARAVESSRAAIALDPGLPDAWHHLAIATRRLGDPVAAEGALRSALRLRPLDPASRRELGDLLIELNRVEEGLAFLSVVATEAPDDPANVEAYAQGLYRAGNVPAALEIYRRATTLAPERAEVWNGLGRAQRALGRFIEAEASFRQALKVAPDHADAHRNLTLIGAAMLDSAEIARLTDALDGGRLGEMDQVTAGFALGHLLDRDARYDEAFARYAVANALFRRTQAEAGRRFDRTALTRQVDALVAGGTRIRLREAASGGCTSDLPVFIVGMPRSGTSLVEQIVASHPRVYGAGELRDIGRIGAAIGLTGPMLPDAQSWDATRARALAEAHLARLRQLGEGAVRVTDKLPDNVFALGLVAALLPGARIILCQRDPRDVCLSAYFTLFSQGNLFSYDLADCVFRLRETERLMSHWLQELPLAIHSIRYEMLIEHFVPESQKLIQFLGLDWDPACLAFYETKRPVLTASTWQVRQPLYSGSVGRWRHYAAAFRDLPPETIGPKTSEKFTPPGLSKAGT